MLETFRQKVDNIDPFQMAISFPEGFLGIASYERAIAVTNLEIMKSSPDVVSSLVRYLYEAANVSYMVSAIAIATVSSLAIADVMRRLSK